MRYPFEGVEEVLILYSRLKKSNSQGKFYKSSAENRPYYNKQEIFSIIHRQVVDGKYCYCLNILKMTKKLKNRYQREEICSLADNFN